MSGEGARAASDSAKATRGTTRRQALVLARSRGVRPAGQHIKVVGHFARSRFASARARTQELFSLLKRHRSSVDLNTGCEWSSRDKSASVEPSELSESVLGPCSR